MTRTNILKWVATAFTLSGALSVSLSWEPYNMILLNIGSALFLVWGYLIKDKAIISVNVGLLAIYVYGLAIRFAI
jgi:hypothetical protein